MVLIAQQRALESALAGFTSWLDHQPIPPRQRRHTLEQVARFLRWRQTDFSSLGSAASAAAWCYLQWCRHERMTETTVMRTWAALEMFLAFAELPDESRAGIPAQATRRTPSEFR